MISVYITPYKTIQCGLYYRLPERSDTSSISGQNIGILNNVLYPGLNAGQSQTGMVNCFLHERGSALINSCMSWVQVQ